MRLVDEIECALLEPSEGLLGDFFLILLGLEVAAGEEGNQVLQFAALKLGGEGDAQHVRIGGVVNIVGLFSEPSHCRKELRGGKGGVLLFNFLIEVRGNSQVAEVVDGLAEQIAAVCFVAGNLRHGEVGLAELSPG